MTKAKGCSRRTARTWILGSLPSFWAEHDEDKTLTLGCGSEAGEFELEFGASFEVEWAPRWVSSARVRFPDNRELALEPGEGRNLRLADAQSSEVWRSLLAEMARAGHLAASAFLNSKANQSVFHEKAQRVTFFIDRLLGMMVWADPAFNTNDWPEGNEVAGDAAKWVSHDSPTNAMLAKLLEPIRHVVYLGPLRHAHPRTFVSSRYWTASAGHRGEDAAHLLSTDEDLPEKCNEWLRRLNIPYSLSVKFIQDDVAGGLRALRLYRERAGGQGTPLALSPADVGFGIGQIRPIIMAGYSWEGHAVCVEQPEIHLHPRLQADLADFFIETAMISKKMAGPGHGFPKQWILETHSEALIQRVLTRIRQGVVSPRDVCVLYVDDGVTRRRSPDNANVAARSPWPGGSVVMELRIDEQGAFLDPWPAGFFVENVEEMLS